LESEELIMALYLNGVYESVLEEIRSAQETKSGLVCYLQPYSSRTIAALAKDPPRPESPVKLYISITTSLSLISYRASLVGWESKSELTAERLALLNEHIDTYQPGEQEIYFTKGDSKPCVNLLSIVDLERLAVPIPVGTLRKLSDDTPLKPRTRPGNWSYVDELPEWLGSLPDVVLGEELHQRLDLEVRKSLGISKSVREERLRHAETMPQVVQAITRSFRRNPDVVAAVLERANGICEACGTEAPFLRASDGTPYLEVHHKMMLADGGADTVGNAIATCPNCHRRFHFGV
jgi:5-methylcytosine-specific restriction endonuclease McrA